MMRAEDKIRIVIVGGHRLIREGLCLILACENCFDIVGEPGSVIQAIEMINDLKPDVALIDMTLLGIEIIEIISTTKLKSPATKALILPPPDDYKTIMTALKAGAKGYITKKTSSSTLIKSIKIVHTGDHLWVERKLVKKLFAGDIGDYFDDAEQPKQFCDDLTPREQEVLRILSKGSTNKEIGRDLYISEKTVKSHLNRIFKKLSVNCRLQAILHAIKTGLI